MSSGARPETSEDKSAGSDRSFRLLLTGRAVSYAGDALSLVALPFAVFDAGGNAADLGLVLAVSRIARIAFVLVGGVVADRLPRRLVLLASDSLQGLAQLGTAVVLLTGTANVTELVVLRFFYGVGMSFFLPAINGLIPQIVPASRLQRANASLSLSKNVSSVAGPAVAGVMTAAVGAGWVFGADALTFAVSVLGMFWLRTPPRAKAVRKSAVQDVRDGWNEFRRRRWFWSNVATHGVWQLAITAFYVLGPTIVAARLGGASSWGTVSAVMGLGGVVGGLVLMRLPVRRPLFFGNLAIGLSAVQLASLAGRPHLPVVIGAVFVCSVGVVVGAGLWDASVQQLVPQHLMSRMSSYDLLASGALSPLGFLLVAPIADAVGNGPVLLTAAGLLILPGVVASLDPTIRGVKRLADGSFEDTMASDAPRESAPADLKAW